MAKKAPRPRRFSVRNETRGAALVTAGVLASSFWARFWGLMFRRSIDDGAGLLLTKSTSIHSFFMFFRFDAVFLDAEDRVTKVVHSMKPWRVAFSSKGTKDTLELPAGAAERTGTVAGDVLVIEPLP